MSCFLEKCTSFTVLAHNGCCLFFFSSQSSAMASTAVEHLSNFWVVGVVEQYAGFVKVLQHTLDLELEHPRLWEAASEVNNNG